MPRPVRPPKTRVYAASGVILYHGVLKAGAGAPLSVPEAHAAELVARKHAETPDIRADRLKLAADQAAGAKPTPAP